MLLSNKISITVTEVVLIQVSFLAFGSKQKIPFKDKIYLKQGSHISLLFGAWTLVLFPYAGAQPEIFQGRGGFVELAHFDKHFVRNTRQKGPAGKKFGVVSPRYY